MICGLVSRVLFQAPHGVQDIPIIAKDATFLISLATEEFIKRLCEAAQIVAERDKRATVQHKDLGAHNVNYLSLHLT